MFNQIKTSDSDPIQINWLEIGTGWGQIGLTLCPGKKQTDGITGHWDRDLKTDLIDVRRWGAKHVLSLLDADECSELQVSDLADEIRTSGMNSYTFETTDGGVPGDSHPDPWKRYAEEIVRKLSLGESVLIHCNGGLGRTGTFVAGLLVENGIDPDKAIAITRKVRPGAIETTKQEQWITGLASDKRGKQKKVSTLDVDAGRQRSETLVEVQS